MFAFERLDVYQRAIEFLALASQLISAGPRGNAILWDQFRRAALSVPLNIAEASGRPSPSEQRRHFAIARGSAMECAAVLDACRILNLVQAGEHGRARELLLRIVQMLSKMCRQTTDDDHDHDHDHVP
jgi:four helix bundle protein